MVANDLLALSSSSRLPSQWSTDATVIWLLAEGAIFALSEYQSEDRCLAMDTAAAAGGRSAYNSAMHISLENSENNGMTTINEHITHGTGRL